MKTEYNQIDSKVKRILKKTEKLEEITKDEALELLKVTGNEFLALHNTANNSCIKEKKNVVTFVINRNINFTNICYQGCRFCSFSVNNKEENAYLLSIEEIRKKTIQAYESGCTEVCIQGGLNPELDFEYYLSILKIVKEVNRTLHIHAFSPQEIFYISRLHGSSIEETLKELKKAGLDSMPGTAAEILVDKIRKIICPRKINTKQWIEIITTAHNIGIPTTSTMMYGHIEDLKDRIEHLHILREIQKQTMGFTEFVPLPFINENPILSKLPDFPLKPHYGMGDFKLFCVARLFFNEYIDNIQCSWVKLGPKMAQISLNYGVNDFSGTLMEENISKSAGAGYGEYLSPQEIISIIKAAGKKPAQRDTLYNILKYY